MVGILVALLGACFEPSPGDPLLDPSSYGTAIRDDLPAPEGVGEAPYAGSLGPPANMVEPVFPGTTTTTREGSAGPPVRPTSEVPDRVLTPYQVRGPNTDGHRSSAEPVGGGH
ncbi:MAG: hypothetical protein ACK4YP_03455 [Myxococcota bacterium]